MSDPETNDLNAKVFGLIEKLDQLLVRVRALVNESRLQDALEILQDIETATNNVTQSISNNASLGIDDVVGYSASVLSNEIQSCLEPSLSKEGLVARIEQRVARSFDLWSRELERQLKVSTYEENKFKEPFSPQPVLRSNNKILIGLLAPNKMNWRLNLAFHYMARVNGAEFVAFYPGDIDFTGKKINGRLFEDGVWVTKLVRYPDFIHDRLRMRGFKEFKQVYDAFHHLPFSNNRIGSSINKVEAFDRVKEHPTLKQAIIPYQKVSEPFDVHDFLEIHRDIVLKPSLGSYGQGVIRLILNKDNTVEFRYNDLLHTLSHEAIHEFVRQNLQTDFIMQKYVVSRTEEDAPFDVRIHIMKNGRGKWEIAAIYPKIGRPGRVVSNRSVAGGYTTIWSELFMDLFPDKDYDTFSQELKSFALGFADYFQETEPASLNEIGLDIGIQPDLKFWVFEININRVGETFHEFEVARLGVEYAMFVLRKSRSDLFVSNQQV